MILMEKRVFYALSTTLYPNIMGFVKTSSVFAKILCTHLV